MTQKKSILLLALGTALLLMVPLVGMQFSDEVDWGLFDFIFAGALIFGTGLTFELISRRAGNPTYRFAVGLGLAAAFILMWANPAVGIIGNEDEPANMMYGGVLAVAFIGSILARFQPRGMSRAMFATALAQTSVTAIALIAGMDRLPESSAPQILNVNAFFITLWVGSALLFRQAANDSRVGVTPDAQRIGR